MSIVRSVPYKVEISAETVEDANNILNRLLDQRLITGGQIIKSPARFLWKGDVVDMDYITITSFTVDTHKAQIIEVVESVSAEEVPMICFLPFEGNRLLENWIKSTVEATDQ